MIGTPNAGSPVALWGDITGCPPGASADLIPGSAATRTEDLPEKTNYFTIAGTGGRQLLPLGFCIWIPDPGNCVILGEDDGLVAVKSVESSVNYIPLGEDVPYNHFNLLGHKDVYEMARGLLK